DDLALDLGDESQLVDDVAVPAQPAHQLALEGLPSPLRDPEGVVVEALGRLDVGGPVPPDDQVVSHQYRSVIQSLLPLRKARRKKPATASRTTETIAASDRDRRAKTAIAAPARTRASSLLSPPGLSRRTTAPTPRTAPRAHRAAVARRVIGWSVSGTGTILPH